MNRYLCWINGGHGYDRWQKVDTPPGFPPHWVLWESECSRCGHVRERPSSQFSPGPNFQRLAGGDWLERA